MNRTILFYKTVDGKCPVQEFLDSLPEKIRFGSNAYRIFCFFIDNSVVLTHGFIKKSQRTPIHEIERAAAYRRDVLRRRI